MDLNERFAVSTIEDEQKIEILLQLFDKPLHALESILNAPYKVDPARILKLIEMDKKYDLDELVYMYTTHDLEALCDMDDRHDLDNLCDLDDEYDLNSIIEKADDLDELIEEQQYNVRYGLPISTIYDEQKAEVLHDMYDKYTLWQLENILENNG